MNHKYTLEHMVKELHEKVLWQQGVFADSLRNIHDAARYELDGLERFETILEELRGLQADFSGCLEAIADIIWEEEEDENPDLTEIKIGQAARQQEAKG